MAKKDDKDEVSPLAQLSAAELQGCLRAGVTLQEISTLLEGGFSGDQILAIAPELVAARAAVVAGGGSSDAMLERLDAIVKGVQQQLPENVFHPDVSAYNPRGERDHPRPQLPCNKVWFGGFPVERQLCDLEELELLHALQPGEFRVTRVDERVEIVPVEFLRDGTGKLDRIHIGIKTGDEHKNAWPSMKRVLREIVAQARGEQPSESVDLLRAEIARLRALVPTSAVA